MNSKLHAVCDSEGRPRTLFLTAGQISDYTGAAALLSTLPPAKALLADKGYDADWFSGKPLQIVTIERVAFNQIQVFAHHPEAAIALANAFGVMREFN